VCESGALDWIGWYDMGWDGVVWYGMVGDGVSDRWHGDHSPTWLEVKANNVTPDNEHQ